MPRKIRLPRAYEPIWTRLKDTGKCTVMAPAPLHPRIVKAVIKEKYSDFAWKLSIADQFKKGELSYSSSDMSLHFILTVTNDSMAI